MGCTSKWFAQFQFLSVSHYFSLKGVMSIGKLLSTLMVSALVVGLLIYVFSSSLSPAITDAGDTTKEKISEAFSN